MVMRRITPTGASIAQSHEKNGHGHHMSKPDGGGMKKHNGMMKSQEAG